MWIWTCILYVTLGLVSQILNFLHRCIVRLLCSVETMQAEHKATAEALKVFRSSTISTQMSFHTTWVLRRQIQESVLVIVGLVAITGLGSLRGIISTLRIGAEVITHSCPPQQLQSQLSSSHTSTSNTAQAKQRQANLCSFEREIEDLQLERERLIGQLEEARQQRAEAMNEAQQRYAKEASRSSVLNVALAGKQVELQAAKDRLKELEEASNRQRRELMQRIEGLQSRIEEQWQSQQSPFSSFLHTVAAIEGRDGVLLSQMDVSDYSRFDLPSRAANVDATLYGRKFMVPMLSNVHAHSTSHQVRRVSAPSVDGAVAVQAKYLFEKSMKGAAITRVTGDTKSIRARVEAGEASSE